MTPPHKRSLCNFDATTQQTEFFPSTLFAGNFTSNDLSVTASKDKLDIVLPHVKEYWNRRLEFEDYVFWIGLFVWPFARYVTLNMILYIVEDRLRLTDLNSVFLRLDVWEKIMKLGHC